MTIKFNDSMWRKELREKLHAGEVFVQFTKKDGSQRDMRCTLQEGVVVPHERTTDRVKVQNEDVCAVWDLDKEEWRSFRYDAITLVFTPLLTKDGKVYSRTEGPTIVW